MINIILDKANCCGYSACCFLDKNVIASLLYWNGYHVYTSDLVITNSFHGFAFSVNFNTPFVALSKAKKLDIDGQDSRMYSVLSGMGFESRLMPVSDTSYVVDHAFDNIEWSKANSYFDRQREKANAYLDNEWKQEVNMDGNVHVNERLSTATLLHFENRQTDHDGNSDGFMDMPKLRQFNMMHRWTYVSPLWISQLSVRMLCDERQGGQSAKHHTDMEIPLYTTTVNTHRYEGQWKISNCRLR